VKSKLKPKIAKMTITKDIVPPKGDELWELVAPLILLMDLQQYFWSDL
jgi:hypothetical protein